MVARYQDERWLTYKYTVQGWSTTEIAKECGVSFKTISRWLEKFGVPRRDASSCQKAKEKRHRHEQALNAVRDYLDTVDRSIQVVEDNKPTLKWGSNR